MLLVRHTIPEATSPHDNFIINLLLTDTHSNKVKESGCDKNRDFLI